MTRWCVLLTAAVLAAGGCKGKSADKSAKPEAVEKAPPDRVERCLFELSELNKPLNLMNVGSCTWMCKDVDAAKLSETKKPARTALSRNIGLPHPALLTKRSYLAMRAGECIKAWHSKASPEERQKVSNLSASITLPLADEARGYYKLPVGFRMTRFSAGGVIVVVTSGQVSVTDVARVNITSKGAQLVGKGFPGKKAPLHQLGEAVRQYKQPFATLVGHAAMPLVQMARVVHAVGSSRLAVSSPNGNGYLDDIELLPSPASTPDTQVMEWKALLAAVKAGKTPDEIHVRVDFPRILVSHLAKLMHDATVRKRGKIFFAKPVDPNLAKPGGQAHVELGIVQAIGTKPSGIKKQLSGIITKLQTCYATQLTAKPNIKGTLVAMIHGDTAGEVTNVRARGVDKVVSRCVAVEIKKVRFGKQRAEGFRATVQIRLSAQKPK